MIREVIDFSQNHMATTFVLKVSCEPLRRRAAESVLYEAHRLISEIENEVSEYREDSELSLFNRIPPNEKFSPKSESLKDLLRLSHRLFQETEGGFDPSFRSEGEGTFTDRIQYDPAHGTIEKLKNGIRLGFGAIGKGYALDRVRALLEREGFANFLLSAGGSSLIVSGTYADHRPWPLAWSWEKDGEDYYGREIPHSARYGNDAFAVGVSGTLEKGEHIHRITSSSPLLSAWISGPSAAEADAYSTAVFSGGWEKSREWFARIPRRYAGAAIGMHDRVLVWNGEFQNRFGSLGPLENQKEAT